MKIGVPKEIKNREGRVAVTPAGVREFGKRGFGVVVERGAGEIAGFSDEEYLAAGAEIGDAAEAWAADMVMKVKEPQASEYGYFRDGLVLFTYLHLAAAGGLTDVLREKGVSAYGYETVRTAGGKLPLLEPMSEIAGRMAPLMGAYHLASHRGGEGVLLPGVPGTAVGRVVILGGGTAGENAARVAAGLGADVTILDIQLPTLRRLDAQFGGRVKVRFSEETTLRELLPTTDLLIGAVLIPGARAPKLVSREHLRMMKPGAVIVDIAVDQGGCVETTRATTHDEPTYLEEKILHYCVANMPGAYPRTSTQALTQAVLPYALRLAEFVKHGKTPEDAVDGYGLQVEDGAIVCSVLKRHFGV